MLYQSTCIRLLLPNPLYLLLCHYLIIPLLLVYKPSQSAWKGRKDDTKALKPTQCNDLTLSFCINMAVMICNDSIVSYAWMTNLFWCILWLFLSTRKDKNGSLCVMYAADQPSQMCSRTLHQLWTFAAARRDPQAHQRATATEDRLPTTILLLTEQKHLYSPSWKPSCIVMCANPFWTAKHTENTIPILTAKNLSFVCQGKREERLTCLWRNVSDVLISSSFACHSHQIFHQYNLRFTQCLNMIRFPIFLRRIPNNFRSRLTRF